MTIGERIESLKNLDEEDLKRAWVRFTKTAAFALISSALTVGLVRLLTLVSNADDPVVALKSVEIWKEALYVLLMSLVTGALAALEKASRASQYKK